MRACCWTFRLERHLPEFLPDAACPFSVLGVQGVGAGIAELSAAFSMALEMGVRLEDIAAIIHAHPTQSESLMEAARNVLDHSRQSHLPHIHAQLTP